MPRDLSRFIAPDLEDSMCTECGAEVPAEFSSCDDLFISILTSLMPRWPESEEMAALGRLVVDTFGMQHPARSCKSAKSFAAHLTGLCCGVEYNGARSVHAALQRWLNGPVEASGIVRPTEPDRRGKLMIRHAYDAETEADAATRARDWAEEVWRAYATQQELARRWVRRAIGE